MNRAIFHRCRIAIIAAFAIGGLFAASPGKKRIVAVNEDNTRYFEQAASFMTEDALNAFIDKMAGGKVTHFFMCPSGQRPSYGSKAWEPIWTGLDEPGGDVENGQTHRARNAKILFEKGIDPYHVWIKRCRKRGISPWLSPRMNDCHNANEQAPFRSTLFWRNHPELRCDPDYRGPDWNRSTLNFALDAVQDYTFALVREQLDRYDIDGYELDFMRFKDHFPRDKAAKSSHHLDRFVKRVKAYVDKKAKERGHPILLGVRVATTPQAARSKGCDVGTWVREGWVDCVCASPYWDTPDYNMPVKEWRDWFGSRANKVLLLAGTDHGVCATSKGGTLRLDMETKFYTGFADVQWGNGVDGLYLFNITYIENAFEDVCRKGLFPENLPGQLRSYPVSFRSDAWGGASNDLQLPCKSNVTNEFSIRLGAAPYGKVSVLLGVKEEGPFSPEVTLNGQKATESKAETMSIRPKGVAYKGADYTCRRYFFPAASVHGGPGNIVKVLPTPQVKTIAWCEIDLAPDADRECREAASGRRCSLDSFPAMENEADDTARIQRAIDANPSGVLFVPAGVYKVSSTLKVFNLCSIDMDKNAILRAVKEIPYVLHVAVYHEFNKLPKESDRRQDYNMFVRGGKIDGDGLASCMSIEGYCHFTLRDMTFMNGSKVGLMVDEKAGGYELVADNLYFKCVKPGLAGNVAVYTRGGDSHYTDCISVNYTIGFHLTNPNTGANRLTRCHVWGNMKEMLKDSIAFWIDSSNGNILRDCYADTAQTGFLVDGSCNRLLGCSFENNRRYGLDNITIIRHPRGRLLVSECNFGKPSQNFKVYDGCGTVVWRDITYLGFAPGDDCPGKLEYPQ